MDPMDPDKLAHFKALIGFDLLPRSRAGGPYPAVAWPDPLQAPGVHGEGWTIAADTPGARRKAAHENGYCVAARRRWWCSLSFPAPARPAPATFCWRAHATP